MPDTAVALSEPFGDRVELRPFPFPGAAGVSSAKAQRVLGRQAAHGWRDHLNEDGTARQTGS